MKKTIHFLALGVFITSQAFSQLSQQERDSINRLSKQAHQLMMKQLGITELRPGPSGNPEASNAANTDESKASPLYQFARPFGFQGWNGSDYDPSVGKTKAGDQGRLFQRNLWKST